MTRKRPVAVRHATVPEAGLDVRQLRAFVTLVDVGRMTAAAKILGVAQSTVSEGLAALERSLGTQLILRAAPAGTARVTAAGRALLPHARGILEAVGNARLAVAAEATNARARIEIIANESISTYLLPAAVAELRIRWPNTRCAVSIGTCGDVRDGIVSGDFDLGLMLEGGERRALRRRSGRTVAAGSAERRGVTTEIALVVFSSPLHPLVRRRSQTKPVTRDDLAAYPLFTSDASGDFHAMLRRVFALHGRNRLEAAGSVEGVKQAVRVARDAIGILPVYAVVDEMRRGLFAPVHVQPAPPHLRLNALLSTSRARHPAADELLAAIHRVRPPAH
jgi:DNA-binding transcriptional LysR family regulator